jgi:hypothetical protein
VSRPVAAAVATGLCGFLLVDLVGPPRRYYSRPTKGQFREAAGYLVAHDDPSAPALVLACGFNKKYFDYYLRHHGSRRRVDAVMRNPTEAAEQTRRVVADPPEQLWVLAGHIACDPAQIATLTAEMTLVDQQQFHIAGVFHFRRRSD